MAIQSKEYPHETVIAKTDIPVRMEIYRDSNHLIPEHWHNSLEILCIFEGMMDVHIQNTTVTLKQHDFFIINSAQVHSTYCHSSGRIMLLQIPYRFLQEAIPDYDSLRFEGDFTSPLPTERAKQDDIRNLLFQMQTLYEEKGDGYSLQFLSLLYQLLYRMNLHYKTETNTALKIRTNKNLTRLKLIMEYVEEHYASPISLSDGASVLSLQPEYFCRFFRKYVGITFYDYIARIRLAHVYEDLTGTDLSITAILEKNGCTNYKLFMRHFKATFGCTPLQLRQGKGEFSSLFQREHRI